ncbi:MAG TPA: DNA recombination protein RmuC [Candidatus Poseidoniales archaeon]|nr:MAG TPA: DNA recombination protein RmuC [Candidatus Poseidoniales archaeon]
MQTGLAMEIIYYLLVGIIVGFIVWFLMIQREKKVLLEAQMESSLKLAAAEEKERAREDSLKQYESAMKDSFTLLAQSAFEEAVAKADAEKENAFSSATESLSKSLSEYTKNIEKIEKDSIDRGARLEKTIEAVGELGLKLSDETSNLTRALKADSQAQGAWGELVLENLLQSLGFQKERDYSTQTTFTQADGTRPRTDFIVELPDNRQIIIDSKVSLTAWERYVNAEQDSDMESALKDHCQSIRNHAKDLASKNYHTLEGINTVEFVLMYVPLESAFSAAMKLHPDLYMEFATSNHVRIVTGSTIVTTLLLIKELWKREAQTKNQARLIEESGKLHDQIVRFLDSFQKIGHELNQATEAYHLAMERLVEGRGNVLKRTDNLKQLGAKVTKEISKNLLQEANQHHESASGSNDSE